MNIIQVKSNLQTLTSQRSLLAGVLTLTALGLCLQKVLAAESLGQDGLPFLFTARDRALPLTDDDSLSTRGNAPEIQGLSEMQDLYQASGLIQTWINLSALWDDDTSEVDSLRVTDSDYLHQSLQSLEPLPTVQTRLNDVTMALNANVISTRSSDASIAPAKMTSSVTSAEGDASGESWATWQVVGLTTLVGGAVAAGVVLGSSSDQSSPSVPTPSDSPTIVSDQGADSQITDEAATDLMAADKAGPIKVEEKEEVAKPEAEVVVDIKEKVVSEVEGVVVDDVVVKPEEAKSEETPSAETGAPEVEEVAVALPQAEVVAKPEETAIPEEEDAVEEAGAKSAETVIPVEEVVAQPDEAKPAETGEPEAEVVAQPEETVEPVTGDVDVEAKSEETQSAEMGAPEVVVDDVVVKPEEAKPEETPPAETGAPEVEEVAVAQPEAEVVAKPEETKPTESVETEVEEVVEVEVKLAETATPEEEVVVNPKETKPEQTETREAEVVVDEAVAKSASEETKPAETVEKDAEVDTVNTELARLCHLTPEIVYQDKAVQVYYSSVEREPVAIDGAELDVIARPQSDHVYDVTLSHASGEMIVASEFYLDVKGSVIDRIEAVVADYQLASKQQIDANYKIIITSMKDVKQDLIDDHGVIATIYLAECEDFV